MSKGNLLLIDDETLLLDRTAMLLEDIAEVVYTADSGQKGIDILLKEDIHCIICDINMPEMNGVEVLEKIRVTHPDIPFIFYTGHGSRELMKKAVRLGAFDFVDKPFLKGLEDIAVAGLKLGTGSIDTSTPASGEALQTEFKKLFQNT
jgi:YesN/AraC family two-component response regulator